MQEPKLTFSMELKGLSGILKAVDKSAVSLNDKLSQQMSAGLKKYNEALKQLKTNPFQNTKIHADLQRLKERLQKATAAKIRLNIDEAKAKISSLKGQMIATFAGAMAISAPIKTAMDFESAMADVKKVVDFDSPQELKEFSSQILKMSEVIPMTAEGLTQVASAGAQMGIAKEELFKFTDLASKTAVAFDITAERAGDSIGKIKNILNLSLNETGEMMDAINHLSNKNAAKASEIVEVMKRLGGIGKQVGLTKEQTASLATTFIALGKAPETASSAAEAMLKKLNGIDVYSAKAQNAFKSTGLNVRQFKKLMKQDAQAGILLFLERLNSIEPQKRGALLSQIMGTNYDSDIATLISGLDVYKKTLDEVGDPSKFKGSNEAEFQSRSATASNTLQLMKNSLTALGISLGDIFLPYINRAFEAIAKFISKLSEFIRANENLIKVAGLVAGGLFTLKASFLALQVAGAAASFALNGYRQILIKLPFDCLKLNGALRECAIAMRLKATATTALSPLLRGYKAVVASAFAPTLKFTDSLKKATFAFRALSISFLTNPIGLIITAIAAGALLVYKYWAQVKAFFAGFFEGIKQALSPVMNAFKAAFAPLAHIFEAIAGFFGSIFSQSDATKESLEGITSAGETLGRVVGGAFELLLAPLKFALELITMIADGINSIIDGLDFDIGAKFKDFVGAGDGAQRSWYNPLNLFYDDAPGQKNTPPNTSGAIKKTIEDKKLASAQNQKNQTINDYKKINITLNGANASPQNVAKALQAHSYSLADER